MTIAGREIRLTRRASTVTIHDGALVRVVRLTGDQEFDRFQVDAALRRANMGGPSTRERLVEALLASEVA